MSCMICVIVVVGMRCYKFIVHLFQCLFARPFVPIIYTHYVVIADQQIISSLTDVCVSNWFEKFQS